MPSSMRCVRRMSSAIAAAEAALRYNVRPLMARAPERLRGAVLELVSTPPWRSPR